MKNFWLFSMILFAFSQPTWGIYGPSLARADRSIALRACQEAKFVQSQKILQSMQSGNPAAILTVLGGALQEWRDTPTTSALYAARAFCIHELVLDHLPREGPISSPRAHQPTVAVARFQDLGIQYFYYDPDAQWNLSEDPVDLSQLAREHLGSPWGRQAFLMMTRLGWSQGGCQEGPDQFRQVIKHGETFLRDYPQSEVSDSVRLEVAHAYATWWNLSRAVNPPDFNPDSYKAGADVAKQKAIDLYQQYLSRQKTPAADIQSRLKALQRNPKGSNQYDYFCAGYED
jgi:hypothetical protein